MSERGRRGTEIDRPAPEPREPLHRDALAWLRDGPTLVRRLVMAEILGPPRSVRRRRLVRG